MIHQVYFWLHDQNTQRVLDGSRFPMLGRCKDVAKFHCGVSASTQIRCGRPLAFRLSCTIFLIVWRTTRLSKRSNPLAFIAKYSTMLEYTVQSILILRSDNLSTPFHRKSYVLYNPIVEYETSELDSWLNIVYSFLANVTPKRRCRTKISTSDVVKTAIYHQ